MQAGRRAIGVVLLAGLTAVASAQGVHAQIAVTPASGLSFGELFQGTPVHVAPADAARRAEIHITGRGNLTIVLGLPAALTSAGGAVVPLQYDAADGEYQVGNGQVRPFDPRSPLSVNVPNSTMVLRIRLGGTAVPGATQPPGTYGASVTVQVHLAGT